MPDELVLDDVVTEEPTEPQEPQEPVDSVEPVESIETTEPVTLVQPQKMVPLPALQEAREEIKTLKSQMQYVGQLKQEFDNYRAQQQQAQQQAQQPKTPSFEEDPIGHLYHKIQEQENIIRTIGQIEQQRYSSTQQSDQLNQAAVAISGKVQEFATTVPDYNEALQYLSSIRIAELEAVGIKNPTQQAQHLNNAAWSLSLAALQNGVNPGEAAYNLAKKYGYQAKQANIDLNTVNRGVQEASRTISRGGGGVETEPSIDALLAADGNEFEKMWNKLFAKQIKR